jgi:hypothetical protein
MRFLIVIVVAVALQSCSRSTFLTQIDLSRTYTNEFAAAQ